MSTTESARTDLQDRVISRHVARHWHRDEQGRLQCDVCPRVCTLREGQRGLCFVRQRRGDQIVLTTYGRSSGFAIDPIEKKPLFHFRPGTPVLSFGTAGCNLTCKFCQNWDISKATTTDVLSGAASPRALAEACIAHGCPSIAFTYNDPVVFLEYAVDTARACREAGIETVAVTAGYVSDAARRDLFQYMTAANVDLKAFGDDFYRKVAGGRLAPVLDTLVYLANETEVWFEVTTLLIPGLNDADEDIQRQAAWMAAKLGEHVPLHFSAFHPDYKLKDRRATPPATLQRARRLAKAEGLAFVYTGNVYDLEGGTTSCARCATALIERDWHEIVGYRVSRDGECPTCGTALPGRFASSAGAFGRRRITLRL